MTTQHGSDGILIETLTDQSDNEKWWMFNEANAGDEWLVTDTVIDLSKAL